MALAVAVVTFFLVGRSASGYCEDTGGPCYDAAPVLVVVLALLGVVAFVALGLLTVRLLSHAAEPRPGELRGPLIRALAACFAWYVAAAFVVDAVRD